MSGIRVMGRDVSPWEGKVRERVPRKSNIELMKRGGPGSKK